MKEGVECGGGDSDGEQQHNMRLFRLKKEIIMTMYINQGCR